ncbi:SPFH domain/Band 7 family protein [Actinocrispum wychmicini]|uniref:SPFH domain/Band 7 family protein n=2 Tax=Actinocrispum wychmicini TaxID=1213861 RepID=A0A4V2S5P6_9PSEU|nr:SPFH domain/Band 7 family protein [Actinocrispum wychmicini]
MLLLALLLIGGGGLMAYRASEKPAQPNMAIGIGLVIVGFIVARGLMTVSPGEAKVIQFLGRYTGTVRHQGLRWANPFATKRTVSIRIRSTEIPVLKVNDADGNPIEVAAVVIWQVADTARALFEVDNFIAFVAAQTETAVRHIAGSYPYDSHGKGLALRDNADEITRRMSEEIAQRVQAAGVYIVESRLTHLAFAPEIAQSMLQRQQANAVVAARYRIVEGAVGMVQLALAKLTEQRIVDLDPQTKAAMVSNLLVVLCGDRGTQPVIQAGTATP